MESLKLHVSVLDARTIALTQELIDVGSNLRESEGKIENLKETMSAIRNSQAKLQKHVDDLSAKDAQLARSVLSFREENANVKRNLESSLRRRSLRGAYDSEAAAASIADTEARVRRALRYLPVVFILIGLVAYLTILSHQHAEAIRLYGTAAATEDVPDVLTLPGAATGKFFGAVEMLGRGQEVENMIPMARLDPTSPILGLDVGIWRKGAQIMIPRKGHRSHSRISASITIPVVTLISIAAITAACISFTLWHYNNSSSATSSSTSSSQNGKKLVKAKRAVRKGGARRTGSRQTNSDDEDDDEDLDDSMQHMSIDHYSNRQRRISPIPMPTAARAHHRSSSSHSTRSSSSSPTPTPGVPASVLSSSPSNALTMTRSPSANGSVLAGRKPPSGLPRNARHVPITIALRNVILWNPSPDPGSPNFAFIEGALPFLQSIAMSSRCIVHLIALVSSDREQEQIKELLTSSGLFRAGLDRRRVLFCESDEGKFHIVRHIDPHTHVDADDECIRKLHPFLPRIIRCRRMKLSPTEPVMRPLILPKGVNDVATGGLDTVMASPIVETVGDDYFQPSRQQPGSPVKSSSSLSTKLKEAEMVKGGGVGRRAASGAGDAPDARPPPAAVDGSTSKPPPVRVRSPFGSLNKSPSSVSLGRTSSMASVTGERGMSTGSEVFGITAPPDNMEKMANVVFVENLESLKTLF
ncbi:hypothetical protein HK101_006159 [Irineochytrium annulatum]|nr:hypothetical protein HK101_006159 [Irineochytrium annulatum]